MATSTIDALPAATALDGTELFEVVQGGASKKATQAQVLVPVALGVGDIALCAYTIDAALAIGDVVNGTDLRAGSGISLYQYLAALSIVFPVVAGSALSGTWRAMQSMQSSTQQDGGTGAVCGYFVRVT